MKKAKATQRSVDIPVHESETKRGVENQRSSLEGDSGEDRGMCGWQTCAVPDSLVKNKVRRQNQIPAKYIADVGRFPVVDQGQAFVAVYCDDESKVIDFDLPLIIFGDHTRCFKYVDFPFVLGADGTKVLLPNKKLYDPQFYYFAMVALELQAVATIGTSRRSRSGASRSPHSPNKRRSRTSFRRCSKRSKRRSGSFRPPPS